MPLRRGDVAVRIAAGADSTLVSALREATPADVSLLPIAGGGRAEAAAATAPADLVLIGPDVRLAEGWLDGLLAARGHDGTVATVGAVVVSADDPTTAAARVRAAAERPRPRTPEPEWACTLVTRAALDVAGPLDDGFAARCSARGLLHVIAGDVVAAATPPPRRNDDPPPLARARQRAQRLADGLSVTVDARILREPIAGTQVHTLELLAALHRTQRLRLRALVPTDPTPTAAALLASLPGLELLDAADVDDDTPATAVVHRPYQVSSAIDLLTLRQVGERLVVTHQDLLTYHNPAYHADRDTWLGYRRLTVTALEAAHGVVAFSRHAREDLLEEDLVAPDRLHVVPIGVDHQLGALAAEPRRPRAADTLGDAPFLLCLGTDLRHKNRPFAIALAAALRERHGWPGRLALAGTHAPTGSSADEEAALLAARPELTDVVVDIGVPDEREKAWLYSHAAAALYPTIYEGFGLVPFEAAAHDTPCLFAAQAALAETLGAHATLVPWDAAASADRVIGLLADGPARDALVAGVRGSGERLSWDATAAELLDVYERALDARDGGPSWAAIEAEAGRGRWEGLYWALRNDIGPTGLALVGADGSLPEPTQRTLAALARRPITRRPLLAALSALGRLADRGGR
jgi:glycosyltransferase involved in cell wall biosynthesis